MAPTSQQPACMACLYGIVQAKCKLTSQVGAITHCLRFYYKPVFPVADSWQQKEQESLVWNSWSPSVHYCFCCHTHLSTKGQVRILGD